MSLSKDTSHSWVRISHGLNKLVMNLNNNEQETSEVQFEEYALRVNASDFACRSRSKQNHKEENLPIHPQEQDLLVKEFGPMLKQENIQSPIVLQEYVQISASPFSRPLLTQADERVGFPGSNLTARMSPGN